jgi:hypothetical protein
MILRRWLSLLLATAFLIWMADWLFYNQTIGWSLSLFLVAASVFVICKGGAYLRSKAAIGSGALLFGLLIALAIQPGPLVLLMTLGALSTFAIIVRQGAPVDTAELMLGLLKCSWFSFLRGWIDLRLFAHISGRSSAFSDPEKLVKRLIAWILPLGGSLIFFGLFSIANPVISHELHTWNEALQRILLNFQLDPARWFFWAVTGTGAWILLRVRTRFNHANSPSPPSLPMPIGQTSLLRRCLLMFNAVFAVQTILDVIYLFGGLKLPDGMSYAQYAHRGSYPLVATALLAAGFVLIAYRPGPPTRETTSLRRLVLLWLAQNVFLTFTAAWRLHLYANVYSLTRLRVAAAIWMLLVALGLAWIGLRITGGRSNRWLVNRTLTTTFIVLYLCCFVNFESKIAWHNGRHCREAGGDGYYLDWKYMKQLGPEAIPALKWLQTQGISQTKNDPLTTLEAQVSLQLQNWRGWTYRAWVLRSEALE